MPMALSRFCTTSRAAIFSATNNTRLPWNSALAIMLVMVCDLPVPGGPCKTKLLPLPESTIASNCEESTSTGMAKSAGEVVSSSLRASISSSPSCVKCMIWLLANACITGCLARMLAWWWMSFHMTNLLNENNPRTASSSTSHRGRVMIADRMDASTCNTSTPLLSVGSGSKPGMGNWNCCLIISMSVTLMMVSSSRDRMTYLVPL